MAMEMWVNISSGNCLLPDGTKPLPDHCWLMVRWYMWHPPVGNFTGNAEDVYPWYKFEKDWLDITAASPRGQWDNYANPVYGVATICHQVRWIRWGHPSLFHIATSLLIWYKMFCVREISYRLIWLEFINMFSVYAQSGMHSRFNW